MVYGVMTELVADQIVKSYAAEIQVLCSAVSILGLDTRIVQLCYNCVKISLAQFAIGVLITQFISSNFQLMCASFTTTAVDGNSVHHAYVEFQKLMHPVGCKNLLTQSNVN
jgi:hypothetical protein